MEGKSACPEDMLKPVRRCLTQPSASFERSWGVDAKVKTICGQLSPQFVYASDNLVHPVVALIENPGPWDPDPVEVAQVITVAADAVEDDGI